MRVPSYTVEYAILGPIEVRDGDQIAEIPGLKERAILGLLIVEAGTVVSADQMVFELWGDAPPDAALRNLRTHISRLRKSLGDASAIVTQKPGYLLVADPETLDVYRFETLADLARKQSDDPGLSSQAAYEALAIWRGPALADLEGFLYAESEARRLEERRLATMELRFAADLRLGRHEEIIPELRSIAAAHTYREGFWAQLMLALYRSGRAGEALEVYGEAERALGEGLGIQPSAELRSLERSIVMEDASLQLARASPPHNLPTSTSSFIGRDKEISALLEALTRSRLITLTGVGGSGKSRLAIESATRVLSRYQHGVWQVELAPIRDPDVVASAVSLALGEPASHAADPVRSLIEYLRERQVLLVLDNCEHLLESCADLVTQLTSACTGLTVLVTSREPLRIPGETVWLVPPLELPDPDAPPGEQESSEAFQLFAARASQAAPMFRVSENNRSDVTEVCRELSGLPLALELAAARSASFTPQQLLERLGEGLDVLSGPRVPVERHKTMRSALDWSYRLLDDSLARTFRRLGVFRGGWTIESAHRVVSEDQDTTAEEIASLVDKSLVVPVPGEPDRYRFLEPIREFSVELFGETEEADATRARHATHYLDLAEKSDSHLRGPDQQVWLARMRADHDNIRKAISWAIETGHADIALKLVSASAWFWFMTGHWRDSWTWLERSLEAAGESHPGLRARAVYTAGGLQVIRVNPTDVVPMLEQALQDCRSEGDEYGEAWCLHLIGHSGFWTGGEPLDMLVEARAIFERLDRPWELAWSDRYIGDALGEAGNGKEAVELQLLSISAFREMGDQWSTAYGLHNIAGGLLTLEGYGPEKAKPYFERCLRLSEDIGDPVWAAHAINGLAHCANLMDEGDPESLYKEAQDRLRLIGDDNCLSTALGFIGDLRRREGDWAGAGSHYAEALRIRHRMGNKVGTAINLDRLALLGAETGHEHEAGLIAGAVDSAVTAGEVDLVWVYRDIHAEVMKQVRIEESVENLTEAIPFALELAEAIGAEPPPASG